MAELPFAQGFYVSESLPISGQECVNLYPNIPQTNTVTRQSLFGTPGLTDAAQAGAGEFNRGMHVFNGIPYGVNGNNLYRIDRTIDAFGVASFVAVQVNGGVPLPGDKKVIMSDNGVKGGEMCIILPEGDNQFNAYIFKDIPVTLTQISDGDFDGPVIGLEFINGFFLFTKKDGNKFFISNLRQGLVYTATDFADAEVDPDPIRAPFVLGNELLIFGSITFEPFQSLVAGAGFPFIRQEGAVQDKGIDAINSLVEIDGELAFIGSADKEQAAIWITTGGKPQKLSTTAIDNQIRTYTDSEIEDAFAVTYSQSGQLFAAFTFPGRETFVYENVSKLWHTRESLNNSVAGPWRVGAIVEAYGEIFIGDTISNKFGIIDKEVFTEFGTEVKRRVVLPPLDDGGNSFFMNSLEVVGEPGTAPAGLDPQILMSYSDNGGKSFSDTASRSYGEQGEDDFRTIWNQLGRVNRQRSVRLDMSAPIKWVIYKIESDID